MLQITARGNSAQCTRAERLTSGMVGLRCKFDFDSAWDGLSRTAVFVAGNEQRDVLLTGDTCTVPWEVLKTAGYQLYIGVYGTNAAGTLVIPTVYANCGGIAAGTDPSGEEGEDPTPTLVEQIMAAAGVAVTTANEVKAAADAGEFDGEDGASAYDQAVSGGYKGTLDQFIEALGTVGAKQNKITAQGLLQCDGDGRITSAAELPPFDVNKQYVLTLVPNADNFTWEMQWKEVSEQDPRTSNVVGTGQAGYMII